MMFQKHIHYSQELEMAVLGACILEREAFGRIYGMLQKENFYFGGHQEVFSVMDLMYRNNIPIDSLTVIDEIIRKRGFAELEKCEIPFFVLGLTRSVCSSAHLEYHSHIIKSMWIERELLKLTHSGIDSEGDSRRKIYELQEKLNGLNQQNAIEDWEDMTSLMVKLYQHQEKMEKSKGLGITTGWQKLDTQSGGLHPGNLVIIGARPSVGKSAFAGQMAVGIAKKNLKVGIISLEMNNMEIAARIASIDANVNFDVTYRSLYQDDIQRHSVYSKISQSTSQLPIWITDKTSVNIHEIKAKAQKLKHREGLDVLIVDYLQLVEGDETTKNRNREQEVSKISRGSKALAKELEIPVVVLCQLNREVTKRKGEHRYPELSDLRESGSLEQDADIVMFLHRDWMAGIQVTENGASTEREADLIIRKWRNQMSNYMIKLDFDPPKMKFSEAKGFIPIAVANQQFDESENGNPF